MPTYALLYYGEPQFAIPEDGAKYQAKWQDWMNGLGDAIVNFGTPLGKPKTVSAHGISDNGNANRLTGYSMVKADNIDAAVEMAKGSPYLEFGTIDVAEVFQM